MKRHTSSRKTTPGCAEPIGATLRDGGVNFSLYSRPARRVELLLFEAADAAQPSRVIALEPGTHRSYHYWHVHVPGVRAGQLYAYRVHGPNEPDRGVRCDAAQVLLDPYGRGVVVPPGYDRGTLTTAGDHAAIAMKSVVVDPSAYDWEGDHPLRRPATQSVIYEMHVAGFTRHPNSGVDASRRGTYAGMIDKIPYLQDLGVTAVELLPVFHFDEQDAPAGRRNYWGYAPLSFFAPHPQFSSRRDALGPVDEFRDLVKALHRAGIEVILDVVYNHTAEGNEHGPTISFRGIDNDAYYILERDRRYYANYSGTGNTLNANHPAVRRLIVDSLRYWVREMHVDGFRFDLASILARDGNGHVLAQPPVLWDIESDPALAGTKLIAEAWDAAGLYQVGSFVGDAWREWNGRFRDDVRDFFRAEPGSVRRVADVIIGSPNVFGHEGREPEQSINFVTCHDGFTVNDLVSYNDKHNEANGEGNRDGASDNRSWNCGLEGPTADPEIERLRNRQVKNFLATTLLSLGLPMLNMGDEVRRTQRGNNNAYCQDNEIGWFDWSLLERHADVHRFVKLLVAQRRTRAADARGERPSLSHLIREAEEAWHGVRARQPDWSDGSHALGFSLEMPARGVMLHLFLNAHWEPLEFELPPTMDGRVLAWRRWIDTGLDSPDDIVPWDDAPAVPDSTYRAEARSVVTLYAPLA